ncbi:MAG: extracellular solute-binding protein [Lachnospiraceae bacterium]|nr:extracellular solute-binding protein [Lachnospiraceae bacterium]
MKKHFLALLLVVCMLFCLTACNKDEVVNQEEGGQEADTDSTWLTPEKKTFRVLVNGLSSDPEPSNDLPFWQYLEERTNVHIEWEIGAGSDYEEIIRTRLSAGVDLPDLMMVKNLKIAEEAGENGVLVDLAPYWETHFTNTNAYWDAQGLDFKSHVVGSDGSIYALIGMAEPVEGHMTLMYNKDWLDQVGAEVPTTLDEFTDLVYKLKEAGDLNGNGKDDEVIFSAATVDALTSCLGTAFGLEQYEGWDAFVSDDQGVVSCELVSDNMKEYLTYASKLYKDKILDQELLTMTANLLSEKCAADRVGIFCYYSSFAMSFGEMTSKGQEDPLAEVFSLGGALSSKYNNNDGYFVRRERAVGCPTAITKDCKEVELACRWLDVLYADPDVLNTRIYGFEGVDWQYDAQGNIEIIYPEDGSPRDIDAKGCGQIALCHFQTQDMIIGGLEQYPWYLEEYEVMRTESTWKSPSVKHLNRFSDEETEIIDDVNSDVKSTHVEYRDKFIKGDLDIEKNWDKYLSDMEKMGVDELTSAWQMIHDRTK